MKEPIYSLLDVVLYVALVAIATVCFTSLAWGYKNKKDTTVNWVETKDWVNCTHIGFSDNKTNHLDFGFGDSVHWRTGAPCDH